MVGVGGWEEPLLHISLNTGVIQLAQHGSPLEAYTLNILGKLCTGEREVIDIAKCLAAPQRVTGRARTPVH